MAHLETGLTLDAAEKAQTSGLSEEQFFNRFDELVLVRNSDTRPGLEEAIVEARQSAWWPWK